MLSDKDQIPLSELAEQLAESLYRDELRYGGWAVDVGLLGSSVFVADALQELQAGDGDLWKIVETEKNNELLSNFSRPQGPSLHCHRRRRGR
jgi:hypothetical protein